MDQTVVKLPIVAVPRRDVLVTGLAALVIMRDILAATPKIVVGPWGATAMSAAIPMDISATIR
jgi:hypothetical protein